LTREQDYLSVLVKLGERLNNHGISWSLGGSLMLKLRGMDVSAEDIDILVSTSHKEDLEQALKEFGYHKEDGSTDYPTKHFYECVIDGVDVDIMVGFAVATKQRTYTFDQEAEVDEIMIDGVSIYLSSLEEWLRAYEAMNRTEKVALIKKHLLSGENSKRQTENQEWMMEDINKIASFLARRDINCLSKEELDKTYGIPQVDLLILLGNSIPYIARLAGKAYLNGLAKYFMIVGGQGHSTAMLKENLQDVSNTNSEAEMLREYLVNTLGIEKTEILLETNSTNCGDNALQALKVLKKEELDVHSILLMQDPTMQRRSHASFVKEWKDSSPLIISYAPFVPLISSFTPLVFQESSEEIEYWNKERFLSLLMGEIPRLRDDKDGYGPKGKGFIDKVDIPIHVEKAYQDLLEILKANIDDRTR